MKKRCNLCAGELQERVMKIKLHEGYDLLIIKVKANVCEKCGWTLYSEEAADKIVKIKEKIGEYIKNRLPKIKEICDKVHMQRIGEVYETLEIIS